MYHKYNLWTGEEKVYDIDNSTNLVFLDTEFGRLGQQNTRTLIFIIIYVIHYNVCNNNNNNNYYTNM